MASRGRQPVGVWDQSAPVSYTGPDGPVYRYAFADADAPPPAGSVAFSDFRGAEVLEAAPAVAAESALAYQRCRHYDPTPGLWLTDDGPAPATA